jgi:hypothetical protein
MADITVSSAVHTLLQASTQADIRSASGVTSIATVTAATGIETFLATPTSANLASSITNETGSGSLVFGTNPTLTGAALAGAVTFSANNTHDIGTAATAARNVYASTGFHVAIGQFYNIAGVGTISGSTDGVFRLKNVAGSAGAGSLCFGSDTSASARIKGNGTELQVRLGDDSAYAAFRSGSAGTSTGTSSKAARIGGKIKEFYTDAGNVNTTETDLYSYTTEASLFGANGENVECVFSGAYVGSAFTKQVKAYFAGTAIFDSGALAVGSNSSWRMEINLIRVSSTVVRYSVAMNTSGASTMVYTNVGELTGLTLSNTNILKITGTAGAGGSSNDIVAKMGVIHWSPVSV